MIHQNAKYGVRIILAGLTACGKSTHADRLAVRHGVRYVPMRPIMRAVSNEIFGERKPEPLAWTRDTDARRGIDDRIDIEADRRIYAEIVAEPGVFDAWALPWLYDRDDAVRVWIEATLASRAERCKVSFEMRGEDPPHDPVALINDKDEFTRSQLRRLYGIELGPDPDVFDVIVENSKMMTSSTRRVAESDADLFSNVLFREVERHLPE